MKPLLIAALLLAFLSVSAVPNWYLEYRLGLAEQRADYYEEQTVALRADVQEQRMEIHDLEEETERLADFEISQALLANRKAQIASASSNLTAISQSLFQARTELGRILAKTARIESALGSVRAIRVVCCGSMEPYIDANDMVFVLDSPQSVGVGDVVAVVKCGVMHRIIRQDAEGWVMKGDNRATENACRFSAMDVAYKVVAVARDVF